LNASLSGHSTLRIPLTLFRRFYPYPGLPFSLFFSSPATHIGGFPLRCHSFFPPEERPLFLPPISSASQLPLCHDLCWFRLLASDFIFSGNDFFPLLVRVSVPLLHFLLERGALPPGFCRNPSGPFFGPLGGGNVRWPSPYCRSYSSSNYGANSPPLVILVPLLIRLEEGFSTGISSVFNG